jgi:hypothetical protein
MLTFRQICSRILLSVKLTGRKKMGYTTTALKIMKILVKTGKGFTNLELAEKVGKSEAAVRAAIRNIRVNGDVPVVKKVTLDKQNRILPAKYFIPVSGDFTAQTFVTRGRPSRAYAVDPLAQL